MGIQSPSTPSKLLRVRLEVADDEFTKPRLEYPIRTMLQFALCVCSKVTTSNPFPLLERWEQQPPKQFSTDGGRDSFLWRGIFLLQARG